VILLTIERDESTSTSVRLVDVGCTRVVRRDSVCHMKSYTYILASVLAAVVATGCERRAPGPAEPSHDDGPSTPAAQSDAARQAPADAFMARIAEHCGQAYAGRVVVNRPPMEDDPFAGRELVMHVRECGATEIRIPFHVGDDRSRTWILTRTAAGLRLKHDHRHEDGTDDDVTMYGGDTATAGTERRQEFPADDDSVEMFEREGLTVSVTNVWAMEIEPGRTFLYELSRPDGRLFRVAFDLTTPVATPPAPWGHQ
jgi:hypothetical protein